MTRSVLLLLARTLAATLFALAWTALAVKIATFGNLEGRSLHDVGIWMLCAAIGVFGARHFGLLQAALLIVAVIAADLMLGPAVENAIAPVRTFILLPETGQRLSGDDAARFLRGARLVANVAACFAAGAIGATVAWLTRAQKKRVTV
jgi:hypothetical protein